MDYFLQFSAASVVLIFIWVFKIVRRTKLHDLKGELPPEPPGRWPVTGHLHLLGSQPTMARTLSDLADKHGPVFTINIGMRRVVVVSSREAVKECFTVNDKAMAARPPSSIGDYLSYDYAGFGWSPDGAYWREIRKLVLLQVLSPKRVEALKHVRGSEIETSIKELYAVFENTGETTPTKVVMNPWLEQLSLNVIIKTLAGKRSTNRVDGVEDEGGKTFRRVMREFFYESGQFVVFDWIPFSLFRWMDFGGHIKTMKRISQELDSVIQGWIDEHIENRRVKSRGDDEEEDFIDVMLSAIDEHGMYGYTRNTIVKATVMTLILAGAESTSILLTWLLSLLLNNPRVMRRAKEEIEMKIGKDRWVEESDIKNLPYIQAIVKETLRLYPPAPIAVPHYSKEDCQVGGYLIPEGTRLMVNLWKLHRDPRVWSEPNEFRPERFLTNHIDIDISGQQFEYTPFGSGRRVCPGSAFAMQMAQLTIARLLQGFNFTRPLDMPVDMTEGQGFTLQKANALEVMISPRMTTMLYSK